MKSNEIIKALKVCGYGVVCDGGNCPYYNEPFRNGKNCECMVMYDALDLINRQKAEIEELKEELFFAKQKRANIFELVESYDKGRVAGCKDFAEEVEKRCVAGGIYPAFVRATIKRVKEEMTEGDE